MKQIKMDKNNLWLYWEDTDDKKRPSYIDLCIKTVCKHCEEFFEINMTNDKNIKNYVDLHENLNNVKEIAHKADYIRYKLLYEHGGIWLDCDMIVMKSLSSINKMISDHDFVIRGTEKALSINFIGSNKNNIILKECILEIEKKLSRNQFSFNWSEIGSDLITKVSKNHKKMVLDRKYFAPIKFNEYYMFNSLECVASKFEEAYTIAISNKFQGIHNKELCSMTEKEILESDMLIGKLFRRSLYGNV
jgi:mannosyltransferase OCH1-like enzyme